MKLTEEQKKSICAVYEAALTLKEEIGGEPFYLTFDINQFGTFEIGLYLEKDFALTPLADDRCSVWDTDKCLAAIDEIAEYCATFVSNKAAAKQARIAELEKELAKLKED